MKFYVTWRTSLRAIMKNRKRSILTMIGIVIGIASVITIMALGRGFQKQTIKSLTATDSDEVSVTVDFTPDDSNLLTSNAVIFQETDLQQIETIEGVKSAEYVKEDIDSAYKDVLIRGKKESKQIDFVSSTNKNPTIGRDLTQEDQDIHNKVVIIDSDTAKNLFGSSKNALNRAFELDGQLFTIVGIYPAAKLASIFSLSESNVYMPRTTYEDYFKEKQATSSVTVTIENGYTPNKVTSKVVKRLQSKGTMRNAGKYQVLDLSLLTDGVGRILSTLTYFISAIAGISLFIAGVGVMNMMYISVSERTHEIGIRRAMGATERSIKLQFLLEGVTLTLIGGVIGYILGIALASLVGHFLKIPISVDFFTIALAGGVSTAIGLIFSVMPASSAAKKDLIDILR